MDTADRLAALRAADARLAAALAAAAASPGWAAPVPGCPAWSLADLAWHVAEVQGFWAWLVRTGAPDAAGHTPEQRPADAALPGLVAARSAALEEALAAADPAAPAWTWTGTRDVAWVLRRQLAEAVVHTVDAEQVRGAGVTPVPADVALDGLDEWLEVIVPATLPDGPPPQAHPVVLAAVDVAGGGAGAERTLFPGSRPQPVARLTGTAGDLLLTAWRRVPIDVLTVDGDGLQAAATIDLVRVP